MASTSIQPIGKESVQRIVAGQAILDLSSCVKELVDNALDADSKSINIRLFGKGLDIVEVSDDGSGVPIASRDNLAVPYATSKIAQFDDIYRNHLLGFRGEALYSLANLSQKLIVATRTADEPMAQKLEFRNDGTLAADASTEMPRKIGTTVAVVRLLDQLPVRRRDLEQRIAAHRTKLVQLITAYAIFRTGVRIHLMDVDVTTGKEKTIIASSFQNSTLSHTISAVLGPKFLAGMTKFSVDLGAVYNNKDDDDGGGSPNTTTTSPWKVEGLISSASGNSVTKAGQQLFAIHQRPIELPKLARILKSSFQLYQDRSPSIILNFTIPHNSYDINVSPDKRTVLLNSEDLIMEKIQLAAAELWANQVDGTFQPRRRYAFVHDPARAVAKEEEEHAKRSRFEQQDSKKPVINTVSVPESGLKQPAEIAEQSPSHLDATADMHESVPTMPQQAVKSTHSGNRSFASTWKEKQKWREAQVQFNKRDDRDEESYSTQPASKRPKRAFGLEQYGFITTPATAPAPEPPITEKNVATDMPTEANKQRASKISNDSTMTQASKEESYSSTKRIRFGKRTSSQDKNALVGFDFEAPVVTPPCSIESPVPSQQPVLHRSLQSRPSSTYSPQRRVGSDEPILGADDETRSVSGQPSSVASPSPPRSRSREVGNLKKADSKWTHFGSTEDVIASYRIQRKTIATTKGNLRTLVANEVQPDTSREPASIKLRKEEFKNMAVIGQFNLGFILAKDTIGNLWILDQHACDEKYNFEKLCMETTIHEQTLMKPLSVELSSLQEACIHDNLDVFQKNGFRIRYDESKPPGMRCSLIALPHSGAQTGRNAVQYGRDDVLALCALLLGEEVDGGTGTDGNGVYGNNAIRRYASSSQQSQVDSIMARLPKTIAMFASRACRTSIMIGTALSEKQMESLVNRLSDTDQPWNCPHGRPTLQHVGLLSSVFLEDEKQLECIVAEPTVTLFSQGDAVL